MQPTPKRPDIEPNIRPNLHVVNDGDESTPDQGDLSVAEDNATAEDLSQQERRFGVIEGGGESTPRRGNLTSVSDSANTTREEEESGGWHTRVSNRQPDPTASWKQRIKKSGPLGGILMVIIVGALGLSSTSLYPFTIIETIINDKHDAFKSQQRKQIDIGGSTVDGKKEDREKACEKPKSAACRRVSMTPETAKEFEDKKFTLDNKTEINGRIVFSSYKFPDGPTIDNKAAFSRHLKTDAGYKAFSSVIHLDTSFFNRSSFFDDVLSKKGLSKAKQIKGETKEEVEESYKQATSKEGTGNVSLQPDKSAEEGSEEQKRAAAEANKSSSSIAKEINDAAAKGQRVTKFPLNLRGGAVSVAQLGCAVYNGATVTANLAYAELALRIAKFAMALGTAVHAMKAGESTEPESAKVFDIFSPSSMPSKVFDPDKNEMVDSPFIGQNFTDAAPWDNIANGSKRKLDPIAMRYVKGSGAVGGIQAAVKWMNQNIGKKNIRIGCKLFNNPLSGIIGFISSPILGLGLELITSIFPVEELAASLINTLIDTIAGVDITTEMKGPIAAYGTIFGLGDVLGSASSAFGQVPGDVPDIRKNMAANNELHEYNKAMAIQEASDTPFDINNRYSFLGSLATNLSLVMPQAKLNGLAPTFSKLLAVPSASFGMLAQNANAAYSMPVAYYSDERFNMCDDPDIQEELGVRPDMGCYVRTVPREEVPSEQNFSYVKSAKQVDEDDNPVPDSYYANFKEFCTERTDEWGKTSVPVEEQEESKIGWYTGAKCSPKKLTGTELEHNKMASEYTGYLKTLDIWDNVQTQSATTTPTEPGDAHALAKQVADNDNIQFVNPKSEEQLLKFAGGGEVFNECGARMTVSKYLLGALIANANKYKILVNNIGFKEDRNTKDQGSEWDCLHPQRQHPLGTAVDLNNIEMVGGGGSTGGSIQLPADAAIANQYASDFLAALPLNRGGVGQSGPGGMNPTFPPGSVALNGSHLFPDAGNHLHIDARNRENLLDTT